MALKAALLLGGGALGLPGCGGGSGAPPAGALAAADTRRRATGGVDSGGTGGKRSFFSAAVQGIAPLAAAGVGFDTQACAYIDADGVPVDGGMVAAGMTVWIDASAVSVVEGQPQAAALQLRLADQIVGPVESVDPLAGLLVVHGQTVMIDVGTALDTALAPDWTQIAPGTRIRVWGQLDAVRRRTVATRLDRPPAGGPDLVRGVLTRRDAGGDVLGIGPLQATAAPGALLPDDVQPGQVVRLVLVDGGGQPPRWQAVRLDPLPLPDLETVALEGRVTAVASPTRFDLDGIPVDAADAQFNAAGPVTPGQRVAVEGLSSDGVLFAQSVEVQADESDQLVELHGVVQTVDAAAARFTLRRTTVHWTEATRFEGGPPAALRPRRRLELKGRRGADGVIEATLVHLEL